MQSVELFAGAGGLGIGVSRAGFHPVAVIERDRYCCDTIRENRDRGIDPFKSWPLTEGDIKRFDFTPFEGVIDLVSGGPPCQPFSLGGKHRGHADERDLFPEAVRAIRQVQPRAFLIENVKGLKRTAFRTYFEYIRLQMENPEIGRRNDEPWTDHLARLKRHRASGKRDGLHYDVKTRVINAADYGVPQRRERVFFVGFRHDLGIEWEFPIATHSYDALLWDQCRRSDYWEHHRVKREGRIVSDRARSRAERLDAKPEQKPWITVRDALSDLPDPEFDAESSSIYLNHRFQPGARTYPGHTGSPLDEPAKTLKAGVHGVPGGENMLLKADGNVRYFSVRESARLQTFPDDLLFHGSWTETMRQLGNAVPVALAQFVSNSIREHLGMCGK